MLGRFVSAYQYDILFCNTQLHCNADGLSRLPLRINEERSVKQVNVPGMQQINTAPLTNQQLTIATRTDPILSGVE